MNPLDTKNQLPTSQPPLLDESEIESVLQQFRNWLQQLNALPIPQPLPSQPIDLATLVGHFTALRHEVNLQTKAFRSTLTQLEPLQALPNQVGEIQKQLAKIETSPITSEPDVKHLLKSLFDIHDALQLAYRQVRKQSEEINDLLNVEVLTPIEFPEEFLTDASATSESTAMPEPPKPLGFWAKWWRRQPKISPPSNEAPPTLALQKELKDWHESVNELLIEQAQNLSYAQDRLAVSLKSLLAGYEMSISRIEKAIEKNGLTPIPTEGERFDPEKMEVVEVLPAEGENSGYVAEEVRRGYLQGNVVYRYAQVKVYR